MFPYIQAGPWELGPFTIHLFGVLVGLAIILGVTMSQRDADKRGLNPVVVSEMQIWAIVVGFIIAHWVSVIFYFPERIMEDPLELLWIWKGISSFGGFFGGVAGLLVYLKYIKKVDPWPHVDAIAYGFSWAWILGRMGCTTAHDHPGRITEFAFSVSYPAYKAGGVPGQTLAESGVPQFLDPTVNQTLPWVQRFDLGFYEMLFALVLVAVLFTTNRKAHRFAGYNVIVLALMYAPVRFFFDYLRVIDKTYLGLTPGQYMAIGVLGLGAWMIYARRHHIRGTAPEPPEDDADDKKAKKGKGSKGGSGKSSKKGSKNSAKKDDEKAPRDDAEKTPKKDSKKDSKKDDEKAPRDDAKKDDNQSGDANKKRKKK